ncbi:cation transporter [Propioniciclava sp. MC1683]|uniref:cation transporter n=1 Tax=Propioniciclava sp. MC1683 TaxID=2760309 RepID=UPI0028168821|nr:cation transporter [Propioniciclava sp. MC1683]
MCDNDVHLDPDADPTLRRQLRTAVLVVALLNLAYFFVEIGVAVGIGSVSLFADSVDFLEDTAVNLLIFVALGFTLRWRSVMGKVMAVIICVPAVAAAVSLILKAGNPEPPDPLSLTVTAGGAVLVNLACALILARFREHGGSMTTAAFLAARNDVLVNVAIIVMGLITAATLSGWPDIVLGAIIIVLNVSAAKEVWEAAENENLAAQAMAGDFDDD